jgi:ABC-type polysaccharide/polyol phosphate export permease
VADVALPEEPATATDRWSRPWVQELARHRDLLYMLSWREIALKYKQSVMGFMWAVLMPALIVAAGMLVRSAMAHLSGKPMESTTVATVVVKAVPWAFFVAALRFATQSLIANANLVTKISFPREVLPMAAVVSQLFDLAVAGVVTGVVLMGIGVGVSLQLLWVPVLLLLLITLVTGLGLVLSAANLFFRDIKYLVEVVITFAIFFTPVFYEVELFGDRGWVLLLNPVAPILEGLKDAVIRHTVPPLGWLAYSAVLSIAGLIGGFAVFKRLEPQFAERI